MEVISYIDKFVLQDFRRVSPNRQIESIHNSAFPDSFQFPGKITSNIFQIFNLDLINIALNVTPIYMLRCVVSDDK